MYGMGLCEYNEYGLAQHRLISKTERHTVVTMCTSYNAKRHTVVTMCTSYIVIAHKKGNIVRLMVR